MIIGLVAPPKSGKSIFCDTLKQNGYVHISMSGLLIDRILQDHKELHKDRGQITRNLCFEEAIRLRETRGAGYLAELVIGAVDALPKEKRNNVVIDGIRRPEEIEEFKKAYGSLFHSVGICADKNQEKDYEIRLRRFLANPEQRGTGFDGSDFDDINSRDMNSSEPMGSRIAECMNLVQAPDMIINGENDAIDVFRERCIKWLQQLEGNGLRPEIK